MRGEIFEWKHVVGGKAHHGRGIYSAGEFAAGAKHRLQCLGGLVVGDYHDDRLAGGPRHERNVERTRGGGQPGHTPPPRTKAQMPSYALKSRGVLQLREYLADEREDHTSELQSLRHL